MLHPVREGRLIKAIGAREPLQLEGLIAERVTGVAKELSSMSLDTALGDAQLAFLNALDASYGGLIDKRVRQWFDQVNLNPALRLTESAANFTLSTERLRHLIVEELGEGPRWLALWSRFIAAMGLLWTPVALSDIAASAGFSDQAHLSRTTRALAGHPPSMRASIGFRADGAYYTQCG